MPAQIPQGALDALKSKASQPPADDTQQNTSAAAPAASQADASSDTGDSTEVSDEAVAGKVNLLKQYSKLNAAITAMFDGLGVRRSMSMPHQAGQDMAGHINDVGAALQKIGGLTTNFITATHTQHDPKGGVTVAHPSEKLRSTIIPKDSELAKNAVQACKTLVSKIAGLLPDNPPEILRAKSQIALVAKEEMSGMNLFDAGVFLLAIVHPLFQLLARRHQFVKHGADHPTLTGPKQA